MNKHFDDTRYYVKRAGETAKAGVKEELDAIESRVRELTGREKEPEPSRIEKLRSDLKELEERAEGEARDAIQDARGRLKAYRDRE